MKLHRSINKAFEALPYGKLGFSAIVVFRRGMDGIYLSSFFFRLRLLPNW